MKNNFQWDVIVLAVAAGARRICAARTGALTLLATHKIDTIGAMSCNPAIGGLAKGHLVREIDALDGVMGRAIDMAGIQFRMLNKSKGAAVQGPRAQADRRLYKKAVSEILREQKKLHIRSLSVEGLAIDDSNRVIGIIVQDGSLVRAKSVILTTGTFLRGVIHIGNKNYLPDGLARMQLTAYRQP